MTFPALRAVVALGRGAGVVARFPGILAVADGPDAAVSALLALCGECAGPEPGRALARRLAAWLGGADDDAAGLRFGTLAPTERGLGVFLRGPVDLLVPGRDTAITGADATTWTDRVIDAPDAPLTLALRDTPVPVGLLASVYDLWEGVVPGDGVVIAAAGRVDVPAGGSSAGTDGRARHRRPGTDELPVVGRPAAAAPAGGDAAHPQEPAAPGADAAPGLLVFDDGATLVVEGDCLLGREPEVDDGVRSGALRAITLDDSSGAMSRVHAEIRIEDGHAMLADRGSSNGTYVAEPGAEAWTSLPVGRPLRLVPGTRVQMGQRTFTFETAPGGGARGPSG